MRFLVLAALLPVSCAHVELSGYDLENGTIIVCGNAYAERADFIAEAKKMCTGATSPKTLRYGLSIPNVAAAGQRNCIEYVCR